MSTETINNVERLGIVAAYFVHRLANDMTCVSGSSALLESDLESNADPRESVAALKEAISELERSLDLFTKLRRELNPTPIQLSADAFASRVHDTAGAGWTLQQPQPVQGSVRLPGSWLQHLLSTLLEFGTGTMILTADAPGSRHRMLHLQFNYQNCREDLSRPEIMEIDSPQLGLCHEILRQLRGRLQSESASELTVSLLCENTGA